MRVETQQISVFPRGHAGRGEFARRHAAGDYHRLHGVAGRARIQIHKVAAGSGPHEQVKWVAALRRSGMSQRLLIFVLRSGCFSLGCARSVCTARAGVKRASAATDAENHVSGRDLMPAGALRAVVELARSQGRAVRVNRVQVAVGLEQDSPVVQHVVGQVPAGTKVNVSGVAAPESGTTWISKPRRRSFV